MTGADEPRPHDDLVEPLFAGISGADAARRAPAEPRAIGEPGVAPLQTEASADAWHRAARARLQPAEPPEPEPSTFGLAVKALLLILALVAAGTLVYLTFGV